MKNEKNEKWAYVPRTNRRYKVSSEGQLFHKLSSGKWRELKGTQAGCAKKTPYGNQKYIQVVIDGRFEYLHRVVLSSFVKEPRSPKGCIKGKKHFRPVQVDHVNGDINDNRLENLQWILWNDNIRGNHKAYKGERA